MSIALTSLAALAMLAGGGQEYAPSQDGGAQRGAPRGSYADSCTGSYINQGRLYADCRDTRGNVRSTSIEVARCSSSDIGNDNGLLVCYNVRGQYENNGNGGNNGGGWGNGGNNGGNNGGGWGNGGNNGGGWGGGNNGGGWGNGGNNGGNNGGGWGGNNGRNSITVYSDSNYRGQSQSYRNEIADLSRSGLNDQISSVEVNGAWEVCTDAYFRGNCQIINSNVRNLGNSGLNDRISSMRPARSGGGRW